MSGLAVEFSYKAPPNGPLGQRARAGLVKREVALRMIEDYDGRADLSVEPDLSDIPEFAWSFFGGNVSAEDTADEDVDSLLWLGADERIPDWSECYQDEIDEWFEQYDTKKWAERAYGHVSLISGKTN